MDYVIEHDIKKQIITVTAKGKWELEKDNEMIRQIMQAVEESGSKKVLVDIRELHFNLPMLRPCPGFTQTTPRFQDNQPQSGACTLGANQKNG